MERHALIRIMIIDRLIRDKSYPTCPVIQDKIKDKLGYDSYSIRTVMRDINELRNLGAPVEFDRKKNGFYYTNKKFSLPKLNLTEGEMVAVLLGAELIRKYKNTPFEKTLDRAFSKIKVILPESISLDLKNIEQVYSFDLRQSRKLDKRLAGIFEGLVKAIKEKRSIEVKYYSIGRNATRKRVIDPYHLRHTQGAWYLIGFCHLRKAVRTFAVNQIKSIKLLKDKFEVQAGFSAEKFFEHSFGLEEGGPITKVVVRLDKEIARWFEDRILHPSQQTKENKDGSLTLTFKVAGTEEIKRWILSQGSHAKVIEPRTLAAEIRAEAKAMISN